MTVRDMIEMLQKGNPDAEVVTFGHFGEVYELRNSHIAWRAFGHYEPDATKCEYLSITVPDIGPEPDE